MARNEPKTKKIFKSQFTRFTLEKTHAKKKTEAHTYAPQAAKLHYHLSTSLIQRLINNEIDRGKKQSTIDIHLKYFNTLASCARFRISN